MDDQQRVEIYEKALFIVKESGKKDGIYCHLEKNGMDIFYSEYDDLLSVYWKNTFVFVAKRGTAAKIMNDLNLQAWIDQINKEFRVLMSKTKTVERG
jgi:hypothetical protein